MRTIRSGGATSLLVAMLVAGCSGASPARSVVEPSPSAAATEAAPSPAVSSAPRSASPSAAASSQSADLLLVAIGDSIPFNSPDDCPGCTGFVDRYGDALAAATGQTVAVHNRSAHDGHTIDDLLERDLAGNEEVTNDLEAADAIIVGIAHNDVPMNRDDDACDGAGGDNPNWSKFTDECIATEVARFTPKYTRAFEQIAALREGKPTVLRTVNRYNDWIGWPGHQLSAEGVAATAKVIKAWNKMLCAAAEANGFLCADISAAFNGTSGTEPAADLLANDYTHPSDKGNEAIAAVLEELRFAPLSP
jgi:lysophospholipase L1-like esterase